MSPDSVFRAGSASVHPSADFPSLNADSPVVRSIAGAMVDADTANRRLRNAFASSIGLSALEFTALMNVGDIAGITPKVLAAALDITTGAVTAMTDRLVGAGLVERRPNPNDRRSVLLALTDMGARARDAMFRQYYEALARAVEAVPGVSSEVVTGLLLKAAALIDETAAAIESTPTLLDR